MFHWCVFLFTCREDVCPLWGVFYTYKEKRKQIFRSGVVYTNIVFITILSLFMISFTKAIFLYVSRHLCLFAPLPLLYRSSEGEESRWVIKALVGARGQEETSLPSFLPAHQRRRRRPPSSPPSPPPRPLGFLSVGVARASRLLPDRGRDGGGDRAGAPAQEVWLSGHQLPPVAPGNARQQRSDGPPA